MEDELLPWNFPAALADQFHYSFKMLLGGWNFSRVDVCLLERAKK